MTIKVDEQRADELRRQIETATDPAERARLQAEYRRTAAVERISAAPIQLRGDPRALPARSSARPAAAPTPAAPTPTRVKLAWEAQQDLDAMVDLILERGPQLEHGGFLSGHVDDQGRVVVRMARINELPAHSPFAVATDAEAMKRFEALGRGRIIGDWHSHPSQIPLEPSQADFAVWARAADQLDQAYLGLLVGPVESWQGGFPTLTFDADDAPALEAWVATPGGTIRRAVIIRESQRIAEARSLIRFQDQEELHG